jgi:hypothetical protein
VKGAIEYEQIYPQATRELVEQLTTLIRYLPRELLKFGLLQRKPWLPLEKKSGWALVNAAL